MATFTSKSREESWTQRRDYRTPPSFIETCPTAAVETPLGQARCRDSVDLVGDLRPEVLLGCTDDYHQRMFVGSLS